MDTRQLAAFRAAYETGSMAKAAEEVVITPQGLSRLVCSLEAELGGQLFVRTSQGVVPTERGRRAYPKAVRALALMESMRPEAPDEGEVLAVGSTSGGLTYFGEGMLRDFASSCPGLSLHIEEGNDRRIALLVDSAQVDCGILSGAPELAKYDARLFARHPHALIVRADDDLARIAARRLDGCVTLADLQGRAVGIMGEGYSPHRYIPERLLRDGVTPAELVGFAEMYTGIVRVRAEGLVALTTDFVVPPGSDDGLAVLPFRDKQFTWDEYIVVPRGSEVPRGVAKLWDFLPAWYARHEREIFPWRGEDGPWPLMGARRAG